MLVLGIETSCDETSAAVVEDGRRVRSSVVSSQIEIHKRFGGVVPEVASRNHTMAVINVIDEAIASAGITAADIDAVAVTYGAGLVGALLIGISAAKAISYAWCKPLIAVNHIHSHIAANYLAYAELEPPFLCAVVSGGHTSLVGVKDYTTLVSYGATVDDAAGEALDKIARVLGLPYPGGVMVDKMSQGGNADIEFFRNAPIVTKGYDFSYSGLKTAAINYIRRNEGQYNINDVCASLLRHAMEPIVSKAFSAAREFGYDRIALAGGVAANSYLRRRMTEEAGKSDCKVYLPPLEYCTDNAAMVATLGYYNYINGKGKADLTLNAAPSLYE